MTRKNLSLIDAFNAPYTFVVRGDRATSGFDPVANQSGIPFISTELSGGANVDPVATIIGLNGVKNVMQYLGMIESQPVQQPQTQFLNGLDGSSYLSATFSGIFEPYRELGEHVEVGDIAGQLYATEEVERTPLELKFDNAGTILVRRNGARVRRGSHLFLVATRMDRDDVLAKI